MSDRRGTVLLRRRLPSRTAGGRRGVVGGGIGIGGIIIALAASYFLGIDPSVLLGMFSGGDGALAPQAVPASRPPADDEMTRFVAKVLADTEDTWRGVFRQSGHQYQDPKLVLYTGA
ncbi:MAG: hypothetical protein H6Q86_4835, partial [candidate division NC10 bacterium]|nr:hypothetical protein [candidate division NC10 bacterium]